MRRRGTSLAGAVAVITIALLAVLTVGTSASFNVQMLLRTENAQIASLLADSALQQGIAELSRRPDWGSNVATDKVEYAGPVERSSVRLTFDETAGVPFSTNNQTGTNPTGWTGTRLLTNARVPEKRVHLVAVATCRGVTRTREAVIHVPNYTVALGSTGPVLLRNSTIGSLPSAADLAELSSNPSLLGPADLVTNATGPTSVVLQNNSRVEGNVQTRGDAVVTRSVVAGEVRNHFGSLTALPDFEFDDYDPEATQALNYETLPVTPTAGRRVVGLARCGGTVTITSGDLELDNALVFVTGDLVVNEGIKGTGAVIVKGSTTVRGGSNLSSDDQVALLSRGNINMLGTSGQDYTFQGLVYTQGNFTARNFTVVGGFIADGRTPGTGGITMEDSKGYQTPTTVSVNLNLPVQIVLQVASTNGPNAKEFEVSADKNEFDYGLSPVAAYNPTVVPEPLPGRPPADYPLQGPPPAHHPREYDTPEEAAEFNNPTGEWDWWNPALLEINRERVNGAIQPVYYLKYKEGGFRHNIRKESRAEIVEEIVQLCAAKCPAYNDGIDANGDPYPPEPLDLLPPAGPDLPPEFNGLTRETNEFRRLYYTKLLSSADPFYSPNGLDPDQPPRSWEDRNRYNANGVSANFYFDPNRFLNENEKVRISAWTEY